ncbi:MAG: thiamine-phosphate kinase [Deltaproteobacteria bacterium RBG_13_65_10]|nr:MAG: thiamine-phosphate kinase [Deltaproteobacteria bacterium RBG_13_65_10]
MKLSDLGEFGLIDRIAKLSGAADPRVICGIGDDCAVIESGTPGKVLLVTTDLLVEGIHFRRHTTTPRLLGRKALAANLSDVAAMGGSPHVFTVSLAVRPNMSVAWVESLYDGIEERADEAEVSLVGGDTAATSDTTVISVTLLGECPKAEVIYRHGARPGDSIYVTGAPGESAAGLAIVTAEAMGNLQATALGDEEREDFDRLRLRHLDPEPRLQAGRMLASRHWATAMIDVSDGLAADLGRILERSGAGARVEAARLPISVPLRAACERLALDPLDLALGGGEDYELLFTAPPDLGEEALSRSLGIPVSWIGVITEGLGDLRVVDPSGRERPLEARGFEHFHR